MCAEHEREHEHGHADECEHEREREYEVGKHCLGHKSGRTLPARSNH